jgi:hypothetical protein
MERTPKFVLERQNFLFLFLLFSALYFIYFSPIHTAYYYGDETGHFFSGSSFGNLKTWIMQVLKTGRPVTFFLFKMMGRLVNSYQGGLQFIRVLEFLGSYFVSVFLFSIIRQRNISLSASFFLILFIWAQPVFQILHVYSLAAVYVIGIFCSYLAFILVCSPETFGISFTTRFIFSVVLLLIAWVIFPAAPFCGLAPLAFYALTSSNEEWNRDRKYYLLFVCTLIATIPVFVLGYKITLQYFHPDVSHMTEESFALLSPTSFGFYLRLLNPMNYMGPFEWWNYIYPIRKMPDILFFAFTSVTLFVWFFTGVWAFFLELKSEDRSDVVQRYLLAFGSVALCFLPLVADQFSKRQHLYIACVPALVLVFFYGASRCVSSLPLKQPAQRKMKALAVAIVVLVALGAQADVYRALVSPSVIFDSFVKNEMLRQLDKEYQSILVIKAKSYCDIEPCRGFMGRRMSISSREDNPSASFYQKTLEKSGGRKDIPVQFMTDVGVDVDLAHTILIDHRILRESLVLRK